jgi:threonine/homoserine/homoserine lactone efflux protein
VAFGPDETLSRSFAPSWNGGDTVDYLILVISGVVMGLIAAVPVGPVNLICIRRSFAFSPLNGFVSGLGAALGDGVFAAITFFGLTWIAQLIEGYSTIIELIGGAMLVWFGAHTFFAPPAAREAENADKGASTLARAIASTFALTVTNPMTLFAFASMFASFRGLIGGPASYVDAAFVVGGVVGGSAGWWLVLTTVIGLFHARIDGRTVRHINRVSGLVVGLFGLAVLVRLVHRQFFAG